MSSMKSDLQNNPQNENIISNKDNSSNFTVKYSNDIKNHVKKQVNILDILDTMVASNVEASVAANGVRDNVIACADDGGDGGGDNLIKDDGAISQNSERSPQDGSIGTRRKRSGDDYGSCCNELSVYINVVEDDAVKDIHNKWVGSYLLQSSMSNANLLVYERQTSKRYLYIRR